MSRREARSGERSVARMQASPAISSDEMLSLPDQGLGGGSGQGQG